MPPHSSSFVRSPTDLVHGAKNQPSHTIPSHFTFRSRPTRDLQSERALPASMKSFTSSKFKSHDHLKQKPNQSKSLHQKDSPPIHTWTPTLSEQDAIHSRAVHGLLGSKARQSSRYQQAQQHHSKAMPSHSKKKGIQHLSISARSIHQHAVREKQKADRIESIDEDCKFKRIYTTRSLETHHHSRPNCVSLAVGSDHKGDDSSHDDESTSSDGHTSTLTRCSHATIQRDSDSSATQSSTSSDQYHRATPTRHVSAGKLSRYRRRAYNLALPPVVEQVNDEDAGDESH